MLRPTIYLARASAALFTLGFAACAPYPQRVHEEPIMVNSDRVVAVDAGAMAPTVAADQMSMKATMDSVYAAATAGCSPESCDLIARGELGIGMTEVQVYAATRSLPASWVVRRGAGAAVMVPATRMAPADRLGQMVMVQLDGGRAAVISRRGPQGILVASRPQDAGAAAMAKQAAAQLIREGDDLVMANDMDGALNRYDRASVLDPDAAEVQYKAARLLDLQMRPQEALMRYQRFLLSMDLERIKAHGEANAKLAEAIALAQQRILVLEKQVK